VIRKTMPANLFTADVLRQAYLRANPALVNAAIVRLRPGQVLQVPDVATVRAVVMSESGNSNGRDSKISLHSTAPVVSPTVAATASDLNPPIAIPRLPANVAGSANPAPEVPPEEKRKWVRYP
jgi:Tfp pilus assembly protein FimV